MRNMGIYAEELAIWEENIALVMAAAALHDIGKIAVPDTVLCKQGELTQSEMEVMKGHVALGTEMIGHMIENLKDTGVHNRGNTIFLEFAYDFARAHHERWDGGGYPEGLPGEDIPLPGRVLAVVDAYDTLVHGGADNGAAMRHEDAVTVIEDGAGTLFDPQVVGAFLAVQETIGVLG
jgi:putative two-component system response regulator